MLTLLTNIKNLIKQFFNRSDFAEIESILSTELKSVKSNKVSKSNSVESQLNTDFSKTNTSVNLIVDLILTFAEEKLTDKKYLEFLINLGEVLISSSNFYSSIPIFKKIISITGRKKFLKDVLANGYYNLGDIYSRQADFDLSLSYLRKAFKIFKSVDNKEGMAKAENLLGTIYGDCGKLEKSKQHFEKCLEYIGKKRNPDLRGKILINLGIIENIKGNHDSAYSNFNRALKEFSKKKDSRRIAEIKHNIGMVFTKKEDFKNANKSFDESISISIDKNYLNLLSISYSSKAFVYSTLNDDNLAIAFADKSNEIAFKINDKLTVADNYKIKGIILRNNKKYKDAENYFLTSIRLNKDFDNRLNKAETEFELSILYKEMSLKEKSEKHLNNSLKYFKNSSYYQKKKIEYKAH